MDEQFVYANNIRNFQIFQKINGQYCKFNCFYPLDVQNKVLILCSFNCF